MATTLKPVLAISEEQAQAIIDRVAPGRPLARIGELLVGEISAVFEIELERGPPAFVLKVYPEALQWKMQKEVTVARLLDRKLSVPTPRILLADDSKSLIDFSFVVMERLDGKSLSRLGAHARPRRTHERSACADGPRVARDPCHHDG